MSVILVLVGQCGNQLGDAFLREISETCEISAPAPTSAGATRKVCPKRLGPFFATDGFARCVQIDAEPKVVTALHAKQPKASPLYRPDNAVTGNAGRANCWTLGYCGFPEFEAKSVSPGRDAFKPAFRVDAGIDQRAVDRTVLGRALRAIHEESRRVEDGALEGFVVVHSLAGGTGSGLGSALLENLRYHFVNPSEGSENARVPGPSVLEEDLWLDGVYGERRKGEFLLSVAVAPRSHGETTVQGINTVLTLRSLLNFADATLLLRNDVPGGIPTQPAQSVAAQAQQRGFAATNAYYASLLATIFGGGTDFGRLGGLISACAPDPRANLLTILPIPGATQLTGPSMTSFHQCAICLGVFESPTSAPNAGFDPLPFLCPESRKITDITMSRIRAAASASSRSPGVAKPLRPSVLVLNQAAELNRNMLFRALLDAKHKADAKAYMHTFNPSGVLSGLVNCSWEVSNESKHRLPPSRDSNEEEQRRIWISEAALLVNRAINDVAVRIATFYPGV